MSSWTDREALLAQALDRVVRSWAELEDTLGDDDADVFLDEIDRAGQILAEVRRDAGLPEAWGAAPPERVEVVRHLRLVEDDQ